MLKSFFNWKVLVNVLIVLGLLTGLVWGVFRWLEYHTNHGKEIPVPNVVDMPVQQAVKVLEDMGLTVEVDSMKYDPKYKSFQVLQIYPSAGSRVKEGREIILKVNPKTWAKIEVPDVLNKYKGLAFSRLNLVGLKIGDTIYEANIQKDAVVRLEHNGEVLKPGTLLPKFSVIDLVIGTGPMRNIRVPNLVGLTVAEAKEIIAKSYFDLGLIEYEDGEDEMSTVYYQDPTMGSLRDQGMQIDIWASSKTPAEMQDKIKELNRIYRPYDEAEESFDDFIIEDTPSRVEKPKKIESSKPKEETPKGERKVEKPTEKKQEKPKPAKVEEKKVEKPKVEVAKPEEPKQEAPRERKIIIE